MSTEGRLTEAECRDVYRRMIYRARSIGDPVKRAEAMEEAAAAYTAVQLYRDRDRYALRQTNLETIPS